MQGENSSDSKIPKFLEILVKILKVDLLPPSYPPLGLSRPFSDFNA